MVLYTVNPSAWKGKALSVSMNSRYHGLETFEIIGQRDSVLKKKEKKGKLLSSIYEYTLPGFYCYKYCIVVLSTMIFFFQFGT